MTGVRCQGWEIVLWGQFFQKCAVPVVLVIYFDLWWFVVGAGTSVAKWSTCVFCYWTTKGTEALSSSCHARLTLKRCVHDSIMSQSPSSHPLCLCTCQTLLPFPFEKALYFLASRCQLNAWMAPVPCANVRLWGPGNFLEWCVPCLLRD